MKILMVVVVLLVGCVGGEGSDPDADLIAADPFSFVFTCSSAYRPHPTMCERACAKAQEGDINLGCPKAVSARDPKPYPCGHGIRVGDMIGCCDRRANGTTAPILFYVCPPT